MKHFNFCFRIEERKMLGPIFHVILLAVFNMTIINGQLTTTTTSTTTTTVNVIFPGTSNDMDLTEELYNELIGNIDYYDDDDEDVSLGNVYNRDDKWRWTDGIIPFEFHVNKTFDQDFKDRIETIIEDINLNLHDCIHLR